VESRSVPDAGAGAAGVARPADRYLLLVFDLFPVHDVPGVRIGRR